MWQKTKRFLSKRCRCGFATVEPGYPTAIARLIVPRGFIQTCLK